MADLFAGPVDQSFADLGDARLVDESHSPKWRTWVDQWEVPLGRASRFGEAIVFSISPGEWIVVGSGSSSDDVVDLTHVRAMFRLTGSAATDVLAHLCGIDLGDQMMPDGAAARTLVAGVATEIVRDDQDGRPSFLLLMSRSFARHVWDRLVEVGSR